jgi:murein L,D-transpeptidase YcbB/YkuD
MHGTPAQELFSRTRRDFSHGCIRPEDPPALAELVLRGQPGWDAPDIDPAMHGSRTVPVPIERPLGVFVLYATTVVGDDGTVYFYPDLYGRDAMLARALGRTATTGESR